MRLFYRVACLAGLAAAALCGCSARKSVATETAHTRDTLFVTRNVTDTLIITEADTATARLLLECDERSNALVAMLNTAQGERVNVTPAVRYVYVKDTATNQLRRQAYIDLQAVALRQRDKINRLNEVISAGAGRQSAAEISGSGASPLPFWAKAYIVIATAVAFAFGITIFILCKWR